MQKQIPLDAFNNVQNSGLAYADLNKFLGSVLEKITFVLGGTAFTKAMITLIELKANNKTIFQTDGSKLDSSKLYLGGASDATILTLDLMDRKAITPNARQAGTLDLSAKSGITQLRLEVTIAGATAPTLAAFADLAPPSEDPVESNIRWLILRRHRSTQTIGAAGEFALQVPHLDPSGGGSNFRRVHIYSANLTRLKAQREGVTEFDLTKAQLEAAQKDNFRTPQAGLVVFDPVQDGQLQGRTWDTRPTSGVRSAQLYGTFSGGETITIETEELLPLAAY